MKELKELERLVQNDPDMVGLSCFMVSSKGIFNYTRLIDKDFFKTAEQPTLQFYGDDIMLALQRGLNE